MSVERRFLTGAREADTDEPGLIVEDDGTVWKVAPGGARSEVSNGGTQPPLQIARVTASTEDILNMHTDPVVIVPAPGEGKQILPVSLAMKYYAGATPYACDDSHISIGLASGDDNTLNTCWLLQKGFYTSAVDMTLLDAGGYDVTATSNSFWHSDTFENVPLVMTVAPDNPATDGDGSIGIFVTYMILDVATDLAA